MYIGNLDLKINLSRKRFSSTKLHLFKCITFVARKNKIALYKSFFISMDHIIKFKFNETSTEMHFLFSPLSNSILQKSNQPNVKRIVKFNTSQHIWGIVDIEVTQPLIESILLELRERTT